MGKSPRPPGDLRSEPGIKTFSVAQRQELLHVQVGVHVDDRAGSMGRVGAAGGNAAMESFFSLLQKNVLDRRRWATRDDLRLAIVGWIEGTYHRGRRQRALGRLTPIEFEATMTPRAAHAA